MATLVDLLSYPTARDDAAEDRWRWMMRKAWQNGVWRGYRSEFLTTASGSNGMTVSVAPGEAILDGVWVEMSSASSIDIAASNASLSRIDLVVLRLDNATPVTGKLRVITGTPATTPIRPNVVTQTDVVLSQVLIGPGVTALQNSALTDARTYARAAAVSNATPTLTGGWNNLGGLEAPARYWKDGAGVVHLEGNISGGSLGQAAFTLPISCWPQFRQNFITLAGANGNGFGGLVVTAEGLVIPFRGDTTTFNLANVSFQAYR